MKLGIVRGTRSSTHRLFNLSGLLLALCCSIMAGIQGCRAPEKGTGNASAETGKEDETSLEARLSRLRLDDFEFRELLHDLNQKVDRLESRLLNIPPANLETTIPKLPIEAKVVEVTPKMHLVTLSVGREDGVRRRFQFDVCRGDHYKGRVTVVEVDQELCVASYKKNLLKRTIEKGDSARCDDPPTPFLHSDPLRHFILRLREF